MMTACQFWSIVTLATKSSVITAYWRFDIFTLLLFSLRIQDKRSLICVPSKESSTLNVYLWVLLCVKLTSLCSSFLLLTHKMRRINWV